MSATYDLTRLSILDEIRALVGDNATDGVDTTVTDPVFPDEYINGILTLKGDTRYAAFQIVSSYAQYWQQQARRFSDSITNIEFSDRAGELTRIATAIWDFQIILGQTSASRGMQFGPMVAGGNVKIDPATGLVTSANPCGNTGYESSLWNWFGTFGLNPWRNAMWEGWGA